MADGLQPRAQNIAGSLLNMVSSPDVDMFATDPAYMAQMAQAKAMDQSIVPESSVTINGSATSGLPGGDPQRLPSQQQAGGFLSGIKNFVSDPSAMAQMAIAFNSMRMRPDPNLTASMQNVIERQGIMRGANRTAEWLRSQGRADLADLVEQNPALAQEALKQLSGGEAPSKVREFEYAKSQGYQGNYMDFLEAASARAPSVSLTTGPQVGNIPQGYQLTSTDGGYRMEPIPGGPADIEQQAAEAEAVAAQQQEEGRQALAETAGNVVFQDIRRFKNLVRNQGLFTPVTGISGAIARKIPGTAATDAQELALTIKANIGFDRLQQMREASPTGGALGNVSDREVATLQAVLGSISASQSDEQLLENLERLENIYSDILVKLQAYPNASEYGFDGSVQTQDDPVGILE